MRLPFHIAKRYLFGKKSTNVINVITGISVLGITIGTAALIIILTVFNGLENLISGFFNSFNPPLKVSPIQGKSFHEDSINYEALMALDEVLAVSKTLEELVLYEYDGIQEVGFMKGVDDQFNKVNKIDSIIRKGSFKLENGETDQAVFGTGMANKLNISIRKSIYPIRVFAPARGNAMMGAKPYNSQFIYPAGTFSVQSEEDNKYAIASLEFLRALLGDRHKVGNLEISVAEGYDVSKTKSKVQAIIGDKFEIRDQYEQDASFLRVMQIEKWLSYAIACFTLLLIAFNMVGALWMIVLEKKKDLTILSSMGMSKREIEKIFLSEGVLIALIGFILGSIIAIIVYYLQINIGLVPIPEGSIIDTYPVQIRWPDFIYVFITVISIGFLASILPAKRAGRTATLLREA